MLIHIINHNRPYQIIITMAIILFTSLMHQMPF